MDIIASSPAARYAALWKFLDRQLPHPINMINEVKGDDEHSIADMILRMRSGDNHFLGLQTFLRLLGLAGPFKMTSTYRDSLTHRHGSVDVAPSFSQRLDYAHNRGIDPRLYARPDFLKRLISIHGRIPSEWAPQVLVEDNHLHVQPCQLGLLSSLGSRPGVYIQVNPRDGYKRSSYDESVDGILSNLTHKLLSPLTIDELFPRFVRRF